QVHHALAQRNHIGIIVLPRQARGFEVPAEGAADTLEPIGHDGLAVTRTAQHDPSLALAARYRFGGGPDEERIIHRRLGIGAEIRDAMPQWLEKDFDFLLVLKSGVV